MSLKRVGENASINYLFEIFLRPCFILIVNLSAFLVLLYIFFLNIIIYLWIICFKSNIPILKWPGPISNQVRKKHWNTYWLYHNTLCLWSQWSFGTCSNTFFKRACWGMLCSAVGSFPPSWAQFFFKIEMLLRMMIYFPFPLCPQPIWWPELRQT